MTQKIIAVAGPLGDLGSRIVKALVSSGVSVRGLLRHNASEAEQASVQALGAKVALAEVTNADSVAAALADVEAVVSALNGLRETMVGRQSILLEGAVKAGVRRFISSDFSEDFTKTTPGRNRNLDVRREFMAIADASPIKVTSILNGAFMDMLGAQMPLIQKGIRRVLFWRSAEQLLDFTSKDNVAAYTARVALDKDAPRLLRIAGESVSVRQLAQLMTEVTGQRFKPQWAGSIGSLSLMIAVAKWVAPQNDVVFPAWQGMQYMRDMFTGEGKLNPLDTQRYPELVWTSVREHLAKIF
jgi:nucleoside-diphosphate-sugar epimerase